ncbi:MAG TPA: hypothetical protein VGD87_11550, partial [Archangium sp.]
ADSLPVPFQGPFDIEGADIPLATRLVEAAFQQGWRPYRQQSLNPFQWRGIDFATRSKVRFRTHRGALRLELGDYFKLSWTRGPEIGGPYAASAVFQCEAITYAFMGDTVELEGVWRNDTVSERQYLLDDETLLEAPDLTLTGAAAPDGGSTVVLDPGCDIVNLQVGSILILRDSTQAEDVFTRNGAWRISAFDDVAKELTVEMNGEGAYPAAGSVAAGEWSIVLGATVYPTAVSDPSNYPDGGEMYGKVTDTAGDYSDSTQGNRLING